MPFHRWPLPLGLLAAVSLVAGATAQEPARQYENLQVLPPDIMDEREEAIRMFEAWLEKHPGHDMARRRLATLRERL